MSPRVAAVAIAALGVAAAAGALTLARTTSQPRAALALHLVAVTIGLAWILAGALAHARRPRNRTGLLMVGVGFAWAATSLSSADWSPAFTAGLVIGNLWAAMLIHLVLAFPEGRLETRAARVVTASAYGLVLVPAALSLPFAAADRVTDCAPECPENLLLASDRPGVVDAIEVATVAGVVIVFAAAAWLLVRRWRRASPVGRRALSPVFGTGLIAIALLISAVVVDEVTGGGADWFLEIALIAFGTVPFGFLVGLVRSRLARGSVGGLVVELGETDLEGGVREALARSLGDPSLELFYWLPDEASYVDAAGAPVQPPDDPDRGATVVAHRGQRVALLVHDPALRDQPDLVDAACAAAGMALANERLQAELRRHVEELRRSRVRIVAATDAERRRLERDLHDGAQQRLVSLAIVLRRAEGMAADTPDARAMIERARAELDEALRGLRELARGIHPAVLTDHGLGPALRGLADRAEQPVRLDVHLDGRLPQPVEVAAYYVVAEALTNASKHAPEARVEVEVIERGGRLSVRVTDDGPGGARPLRGGGLAGLADRVEALGGRLQVRSPAGGDGTALQADLWVDAGR